MTVLPVLGALVAGAAGSVLRYSVARAFAARPARLPWAVLIVNTAGSLVAGVVIAVQYVTEAPPWLQLVLVSGFAGGLTTFSTFSTETVQLFFQRRGRTALVSALANVVLGVAAFLVGFSVVLGIAMLTAPQMIPI